MYSAPTQHKASVCPTPLSRDNITKTTEALIVPLPQQVTTVCKVITSLLFFLILRLKYATLTAIVQFLLTFNFYTEGIKYCVFVFYMNSIFYFEYPSIFESGFFYSTFMFGRYIYPIFCIIHLFTLLYSIPLHQNTTVYLFWYLWTVGMFPVWGYYK